MSRLIKLMSRYLEFAFIVLLIKLTGSQVNTATVEIFYNGQRQEGAADVGPGYSMQLASLKDKTNGNVKPKVTKIAVYKCPLEGIYSKSPKVVREVVGRQWTSIDYHAFIVFYTSDGQWWWSLDKNMEGIYIEIGQSRESVVNEFQSIPRKTPVELVIEDKAKYDLEDLYSILEDFSTSGYSAIHASCQHFSKHVFDKVALSKSWDFTTIAEFLSPITFAEFLLGIFYSVSNQKIGFAVFVIVLTSLLYWVNFRKDNIVNKASLQLEDCDVLVLTDSELPRSKSDNITRSDTSFNQPTENSSTRADTNGLFQTSSFNETPSSSSAHSSTPAIADLRSEGNSASTPVSCGTPVLCGKQTLSLSEDQGDNPRKETSSSSTDPISMPVGAAAAAEDFLEERGNPSPFGNMNVVGTLQEFVQRKGFADTIKYSVTSHNHTSFSANLKFMLDGEEHEYTSVARYRNKKDAKQNVAYRALLALGLMSPPTEVDTSLTATPASSSSSRSPAPGRNYKNAVQEYCQKKGHPVPVYKSENVGDAYAPRFESMVTVTINNGEVVRGTSDRHDSKKAAEFQAAERAYNSIVNGNSGAAASERTPTPISTVSASPAVTHINWKNKLQELFQKNREPIPEYSTTPVPHNPCGLNGFASTVVVKVGCEGVTKRFTSEIRSTAKIAEMRAAELAYMALAENDETILRLGMIRDFNDWHASRHYAPPSYETRVTEDRPAMRFISKVTFNSGQNTVEGDLEQGSKKLAESSAAVKAVQVLRDLSLWDVELI